MLISFKNFVTTYTEDKVFYSDQFQRREVWLPTQVSKFLNSLCLGWAQLTTIVLADIDMCLQHSKRQGDYASEVFYQDLLNKGYRWISLDGQNRSKSAIAFANNKKAVTSRKGFLDAAGNLVPIDNKKFKDFPDRLHDRINDSLINVQIAPPCFHTALSEQFQALNSGEPLNNHENRNSFGTPIAEWVRSTRVNLDGAMMRTVKRDKAIRMLDDELVAKMTMVIMSNNPSGSTNEWGLSDSEIDSFYRLGEGFVGFDEKGSPYTQYQINRASKIFDMWMHTITKQNFYKRSQMVSAKMYWAALYACEWAYDNNYSIPASSYEKFFDELKKIDDKLINNSENAYTQARNTAIKNGIDPDTVKKGRYYFNWTGLPHQVGPRTDRIKALTAEIAINPRVLYMRKLQSQAA
jgi:hypothetical protein